MIKKIYLLLFFALAAIAVDAQSWTVYPLFNSTINDMVETPSKLYYTSNGSLYSYDMDSQETYAWSNDNKLSDAIITDIQYNRKHKFLLVVYKNCNMDAIYDNGRVVNLPEISQANLSVEKSINSVTMQDDYAAIATNFGYVIYDCDKLVVKESRNWEINISAVAIWRNHIVVQNDKNTLVASMSEAHNSFDSFHSICDRAAASRFQVIGNELYSKHRSGNVIYRFSDVDLDNYTSDLATSISSHKRSDWFKPYANGYYIVNDNEIENFNNTGLKSGTTKLPQVFSNSQIAFWESEKKLWHGGSDGVGRFETGGQSPVVLNEYYKPEGATCQRVAFITMSADGERVYFTNTGSALTRTCGSDNPTGMNNKQTTDKLEGGVLYDMNVDIPNEQLTFGPGRHGDGLVREDPVDPSTYYLCSRFEGVHVIKDGKQIAKFADGADAIKKNQDNAVLCHPDSWGTNTYSLNFDRFNNLWVLNGMDVPGDGWGESYISILPADKLRNPEKVKKSDWLTHKFPSTYRNFYECWMESCKHSDYIVLVSTAYEAGILLIDTKGTSNINDDRQIHLPNFIDQDNNKFAPTTFTFVVEDQRGMIWVGTQDGIIEFDPRKAFDADFRCNRIKVPRNDGTNYADYLLAGEQVNWISVDPANRKWIATQFSGIYLVSETGDKILQHFTTDNSPLPTNTVNVIEASKNDNMVYLGTNYGPMAYSSDASPAADNMDNVYAYPNPVRPDYSGWITISGLMEGSLVKICDAQGAVIHQGKSEGGMMVWDGCNLGGERVRSGVYFVLASENSSGSNFSAVTKIMVIN